MKKAKHKKKKQLSEEMKSYIRRLEAHDWYWFMSDDQSAFNRGSNAEEELIKIADTSKTAMKYYSTYKSKIKL